MEIKTIKHWGSWKRLIELTDLLQAELETSRLNESEICEYLERIEYMLGNKHDPLSEIHEYALSRFCRALRKALMKLHAN